MSNAEFEREIAQPLTGAVNDRWSVSAFGKRANCPRLIRSNFSSLVTLTLAHAPSFGRWKATRGRVRTLKAARNRKRSHLISHAVLWSAMRPRIAFIVG
jgi:hypothetical protein